ncbi:FecR family protein [Tamlana sp. I1]|uniref:FecR family protein n=1 Tax=Tamlana sp. I1 TaxID=2762061 RepID=UPI00188E2469|nr:FecR family protein [Tamlana sp. I1]
MNNKEINNKFFQKLIERYLDGKTTAHELKLLVNYYESFQKENEWVEALGPEADIKERMLINILDAIKVDESKKPKLFSLFNKSVLRYSVAASVAILVAFYFLFKQNNQNTETINTVVNTSIKVGSDKAILTREDGSTITLEKGGQYSADNIESNGETLIYSQTNQDNKDIAYNYLTIPRGGHFFVKLADGTQVWLNSDSKLKYPVTFIDGKIRHVELLYGEAYFNVSPSTEHQGSKFTVSNNNHEIEVVGTEFNIKAYNNENNVVTTLVHGKVNVNYQGEKYLLLPNKQSSLNRTTNTISFQEVDVSQETSWVKGIFNFNNKSLKEIMVVLSRWYDFDVVFKNKSIEEEEFVGVLGKNEKIEDILLNMKNLNVIKDYKFDGKTIIIE